MSRYPLRQRRSPLWRGLSMLGLGRLGLSGSIRNQLVALNILMLAVLFGGFGLVVRYTVRSFMMDSVNRELDSSVKHFIHPPPPGGPHGGPHGGRHDGLMGGPGGGPPGGPGGPGDAFRPGEMPGMPPPIDGREGDPNRGPMGFGPSPEGLLHEEQRAGAALFATDRPGGPPHGEQPPGPPQEDDRFHPQRFDLNGTSLAPPGRRHALWDPHAFALARAGKEIRSTVLFNDEPYEVLSVPVPERGSVEGVVQAPYPLTEVNLAISGLNRALLLLLPVGLLFAGLGGALLTDRVLSRVNRVRQAAERMGAQEFSRRLPVIGNDEFSRLSETFNRLLGRLETSFAEQQRLLEQQRRFTADASHELKTPLTIIKGNTSMALSGRPTENAYHQSIQEIDQAADTMSHLVQDLLLLARSDGGQLGRNRIELLVRELLERAIARVERADAAPIRMGVADETLSVIGNEAELVRLFTNLLDNAVCYTPADGQITVAASSKGANVVVTVTDTGCGIAAEHLPHLGERFYRADSSRSRPAGGTGLGLSICKGLIEAHGGHLAFQSARGIGTTVTVTLPAAGS